MLGMQGLALRCLPVFITLGTQHEHGIQWNMDFTITLQSLPSELTIRLTLRTQSMIVVKMIGEI